MHFNRLIFLPGAYADGSYFSRIQDSLPTSKVFDINQRVNSNYGRIGLDDYVQTLVRGIQDEENLVLISHSFGSWVATEAYPFIQKNIQFMVLISGYPAVKESAFVDFLPKRRLRKYEIARKMGWEKMPAIKRDHLAQPIQPFFDKATVNFSEVCNCPCFYVRGANDEIITSNIYEKLKYALPKKTRFYNHLGGHTPFGMDSAKNLSDLIQRIIQYQNL